MINQNNSLPKFLVNRYRNWKANEYIKNINLFKQLSKGQNPKAMIISCCDSRVHANSIFGAKEGDFFIHRNIANLIPPYTPDGDYHGTSAAIEYGIRELKVPHMIVLGHTGCGGVKSAHKLYTNKKTNDYVFINKWLGIMSPAYNKIPKNKFVKDQIKILEEESIKNATSFAPKILISCNPLSEQVMMISIRFCPAKVTFLNTLIIFK